MSSFRAGSDQRADGAGSAPSRRTMRWPVKTIVYGLLGRASVVLDRLRPAPRAGNAAGAESAESSEYDKTGITVRRARRLDVLWKDADLVVVDYDSLAHSFWRAQELSLFRRHIGILEHPLMDFGCGDGSFASALDMSIDYGVDNDPEALAIASGYGVYRHLVRSSATGIPLESGSLRTVISNSVLEHVERLEAVLSEIHRTLMEGGLFVLTVPVNQFKTDLEKYFGKRESERVNREYHHRNLLSVEQWTRLLDAHGFSVELLKQYQPDWFTFWYRTYRIFGRRGLGRFVPDVRLRIWKRYGPIIADMIRRSIHDTKIGGNIFVLARKDHRERRDRAAPNGAWFEVASRV